VTALSLYQELLARILREPDPVAARDRTAARCNEPVRSWLLALDADGLRISARLILRLRASLLLQGDDDVRRRLQEDPVDLSRALRAYHDAAPPTALTPDEEAATWRQWRAEADPP